MTSREQPEGLPAFRNTKLEHYEAPINESSGRVLEESEKAELLAKVKELALKVDALLDEQEENGINKVSWNSCLVAKITKEEFDRKIKNLQIGGIGIKEKFNRVFFQENDISLSDEEVEILKKIQIPYLDRIKNLPNPYEASTTQDNKDEYKKIQDEYEVDIGKALLIFQGTRDLSEPYVISDIYVEPRDSGVMFGNVTQFLSKDIVGFKWSGPKNIVEAAEYIISELKRLKSEKIK